MASMVLMPLVYQFLLLTTCTRAFPLTDKNILHFNIMSILYI